MALYYLYVLFLFVACSIPVNDRPRIKRREIQDMTKPLKKWLVNHASNPYPNRNEKQQLAAQSHMNYQQVSNWFTNARRRLKNTVKVSLVNSYE